MTFNVAGRAPAWHVSRDSVHQLAGREVVAGEVGAEREHDIDLVGAIGKCLLDLGDDVVGWLTSRAGSWRPRQRRCPLDARGDEPAPRTSGRCTQPQDGCRCPAPATARDRTEHRCVQVCRRGSGSSGRDTRVPCRASRSTVISFEAFITRSCPTSATSTRPGPMKSSQPSQRELGMWNKWRHANPQIDDAQTLRRAR